MKGKVDELVSYLKEHPEKQLQVLGMYHRNEPHTGNVSLGLERADFFTQLLASKGIPLGR